MAPTTTRQTPHVRSGACVLALVLLATASARTGQAPAPTGSTTTVQLLAFNDFHGNLEPPAGSNGEINGVAAGGVEYLATHLEQAAAESPNTIIVSSGDLVGATPLVSSLFHDEPTIEAMNALHLGVASVGNHEFDEGWRETLRMKRGGCHPRDGCQDGDGFAGAAFTYLSANVFRTATKTTLFPATVLKTVGGVKIGFIGETLKGTNQIVPRATNRGVVFLDEAATANRYAARLKQQGADVIVLLIHEGGRQRTGGEPADPNGCQNFGGSLVPILDKLAKDVQIVVAGHSHVFYNCRIGDRLVTSASSFGRMITRIQVTVDRSAHGSARVSTTATNRVVTRDVPRNAAQTAILAKYSAMVDERANTVVGSIAADLWKKIDETGASPLGAVIADAQLAAAARATGATVAFMNEGGVRADLTANPQRAAVPAGAVTYRDLFTVQPFDNTLTVITMTGQAIKRLLEQQFDNPSVGQRKMLQVSRGFTYAYRLNAPAGQRVDAASIRIDDRSVAPADRVRVAASDFLIDGGDGFTAFAESSNRVSVMSDLEALLAYFAARSPVSAPTDRRVVRLDP